MNATNSITSSNKYKHLSLQDYEFIIREVTKHDALHAGKKRNTARTSLIRSLADQLSTSVSNIYSILKDASITIKDTNLSIHTELSPSTAFYKRSKSCKPSNALKLHKAQDFINLVCDEVLSNPLSSIDERPAHVLDRLEFGHWECDLVTGPRNGQNGIYEDSSTS